MIAASVVLITYNEAERLQELLPLLSAFDEVVILDSNSTDGSREICGNFPNVAVYQQDFQGFGKQKQAAVQLAKHDWIFSLDADELPNQAMISHIQELVSSHSPSLKSYLMRRKLEFLGKVFHYGKESKDDQLRFFHKAHARWSDDEVHEKVISDVPVSRLNGYALHKSYKNLDNYIGKFNRYTSLAAETQFKRGKKSSILFIPFKGAFTFFRSYFIQLNILNGFAGWLWSLFAAVYTVVKYTKLFELHRRNR
ncbi:MAG: glycosyltransferase family 2 protein [Bacteroidetes bacterium]|nr:MAG: glycosyltransferase family 2 protein [Bacteroidota bacterium]